jgi:hypothetical protein
MKTNIDNIIKQYDGFFAFGQKQLDEQIQKDIKYSRVGGGLIMPTSNIKAFERDFQNEMKRAVAEDFATHGKKNIIWRELANHEAQISCEIDDTLDALENHNITREDIQAEFSAYMQHCVKHDYF